MNKKYYDYSISDNGTVYDSKNNVIPEWIDRYGYKHVSLIIENKRRNKKIHRLVGLLFLDNPENLPCINHIDGNKQNNNVTNLEWCTYYHNNKHARDMKLNDVSLSNHNKWNDSIFRENTSKNISEGRIKSGCSKNEKNPKFKYKIKCDGNNVDRKELANILNLSQSFCDAMIKRISEKNEYTYRNHIIEVTNIKGQTTIETV